MLARAAAAAARTAVTAAAKAAPRLSGASAAAKAALPRPAIAALPRRAIAVVPNRSSRQPALPKAAVTRPLATATATTTGAKSDPAMMCFQCEQTNEGKGCTVVGVCGKEPQTAALQDLLVKVVKSVAFWAHQAAQAGVKPDAEANAFVLDALFSTLTNVNFDAKRIADYARQGIRLRDRVRATVPNGAAAAAKLSEEHPARMDLPATATLEDLETVAHESNVGVLARKAKLGPDLNGLAEMCTYGIKGAAAYAHHARVLGKESAAVYAGLNEVLATLASENFTADQLLGLNMRVGAINLQVLELLDNASVTRFGHPEPTQVRTTPVAGKAILVSGHDLHDLEMVLKQTEGKGINVFTHGELLPAHGYPGLKKYKHLVGHYGGAWQLQKFEFAQFPGSILMTTNCLVEPRKSYKERIFTRSVTGFPGVTHIASDDLSPLINAALQAEGFKSTAEDKRPLTTGFARNAIMSVADQVIDAVKKGGISRFFVVGGCDGAEAERSYFKEIALNSPKDSVILTLGCGKFRFNNLPLGNVPGTGIPRVLDCGQCNDSYSAIQVAVALANAFKTDVNSLPLSFAVSWFEQKAVAVLLTLLHLGIRNIRLGPNLPAFCTENMIQILNSKFNIMPIGTAAEDMKMMVQGK